MKFGPQSIDSAKGKILGHNIARPDGRRALRKGRALTDEDIKLLRDLGRQMVYVADLEPGDMGEDEAARRVSRMVGGPGMRLTKASTGRVNFISTYQGVLRVNDDGLMVINSTDGFTLATRQSDLPVEAGKVSATLKIIPYAVHEDVVLGIETGAQAHKPIIYLEPLQLKKVGLIFSSSRDGQARVRETFERPLRERVTNLGSDVAAVECVALEDEKGEVELAGLLTRLVDEGIDLIVLAGETAIMDREDIAPRAVDRTGGRVECVGVPVDPGNLLMLAYIGDVPVLGAPGCARSRKTNVIDWVLPRLLVGEKLRRDQLIRMGNGGLLEDTPLRPKPRSEFS